MRLKLVAFRGNRSQSEMARQYGVTQQAWSKWERGIGVPKPHLMKMIADDAGIPMEELFFDAFNNQKLLNDNQTAVHEPDDAA